MANSSVVGIDIGSHQIKAVHLERSRGAWSLANAAIAPTPVEAVQDGMILDVAQVTDAVRQLCRDARLPMTDAVAAVTGPHVLVRSIKIPDMNMATLRRSIRFEAAKHLEQGANGVSIENSAVEFDVLGRSGQPPQLEVLLVVAPQPMVNSRVAVLEGVGLEPVAVDVEAFALLRAIETAGLLPSPGQAVVVMDMGATYTDLNIIIGNSMAVTRSIPLGGNQLTASLASVLNVPTEEAENRKQQSTLEPDSNPYDDLRGPDPARQMVMPFVDELIRELRRSIIYFQSQAAEAGVTVTMENLVLTGGGTQISGLVPYLRERLGMTVVTLDLLSRAANISPSAQKWAERGPELTVALGLALKEYN